ncbi:O-antigen ligase family protein [Sphingomonadaceae bacterium jetA1]|uniref:O-antigen ligase family protein n=1 Tax=Facivitalis istanbulensis TaxID=3075838 RepID=UPI00346FB2C1
MLSSAATLFRRKSGPSAGRHSRIFWILGAYLAFAFLIGGGSRSDIVSLLFLRPVAALIFTLGCWSLTRDALCARPVFLGIVVAILALTILHLVPLPPQLWQSLPGRGIVISIDHATGAGDIWRPLTMTPDEGWNAFYSMFVPLAALVLGLQLSPGQLSRYLPMFIVIGIVSGLVGLGQILGGDYSPLYFYHLANRGLASGIFANRNHGAVYLATMFPMLAVFAAGQPEHGRHARTIRLLAVGIGALMIPFLLVTGSRGGLFAGIVGLASVPFLYRPVRSTGKQVSRRRSTMVYAAVGGGALALVALTAFMSRAVALQRLLNQDNKSEVRFKVWGPILDMTRDYMPFGSGLGSFVKIFQVNEPDVLLKPTYLNHAHNEILEVLLTLGIPGALLLIVGLGAFAVAAYRAFRTPVSTSQARFARLGAVITLLIGIGSLGDYPLRTPSMVCLLMIALLWLGGGRADSKMARN